MRANQVDLHFANLLAGNVNVAQLAYAGGDGIGDFVVGDQGIDHGARPLHSCAGVGSEQHRTAFDRDLAHCFQRQIVTVDV